MTAGEKIKAGMWMLYACANEQMTHAEKTKILKVAYRLLREGIGEINQYVLSDKDDVPF